MCVCMFLDHSTYCLMWICISNSQVSYPIPKPYQYPSFTKFFESLEASGNQEYNIKPILALSSKHISALLITSSCYHPKKFLPLALCHTPLKNRSIKEQITVLLLNSHKCHISDKRHNVWATTICSNYILTAAIIKRT